MPRSSRHKSSKHSSRDARDYSDSEKDSSSKDKKIKEESSAKVSKESGSGEKRKLDSKDNKDSFGSGNGDYLEEYSTSKRRKEKAEDGVNDRWNGGDDDRGEGNKKSKEKSSESRSKRRDEGAGAYGESDDVVKKSSGKSEGKHRESSSRKEGKEGGAERERDREREKEKERDRRCKEGKTEKLVDGEDVRAVKQLSEKTELSARDLLQSPELENLLDRRMRRKRDGSGDGDKRQDDFVDNNDRRVSSREDVTKDGRPKDEKHKDERYRDRYREDVNRESKHRNDKQRDERAVRDHICNKSDDKHMRDDKDSGEIKLKKYKPQGGERDHERDHDHDRDRDRDRDFDMGRDHDIESYQRDRDRDRDHDRDWDWERDRERDRDRDRGRDRDRDRDRNLDYDGANIDDRNARHKDSRGRKKSPDDHDDYADAKSRGVKTAYLDTEKKSLSSSRVESENDRGRSQSRQAHPENNASNNRRRASPNTSSHGAADEYRYFKQEELQYRDAGIEHRSKSISSREVNSLPGASERNSKYRSSEKLNKMDDGHMGELSLERSSGSKASPMGLVDRSPSSTSLDRRYTNRSSVRRSLDIEESGRRNSASLGARDFPSADDRPSRDLPLDKSLVDDSNSADSPFYNRTSQSNSALAPPPSAFRGGIGSPSFMGSLEEDSRINSGARYKRSGDPNLGRGQGNAWRGAPNWSSPLPNGYIPFQHGPPHGGFQAMLPQFPSPPLFGVRPSMEINHSGIPYHIPDADRFASHLRPLGWQNMMDGSGPSHMHGWDGNNGIFRDESHLYGGPDWEQNRHPMNGRGWESNADIWKGQNGDVGLDLPSTSLKEDFPVQSPVDDASAGQGGQWLQSESKHIGVPAKIVETKSVIAPSGKDSYKSSPKTIHEKTPDPPKSLSDDNSSLYHAYLSKLDISTELVDPELYDQLVSLLDIEQSVTAENNAAMLVNLKDGAKAVPKSSSILSSSSLFPATSDSVFQRAMGIYKRERASVDGLPIANGGTIDVILASKIEGQVSLNDEDTAEELVSNHNAEMAQVKMSNLNEIKLEIVPTVAAQEISEIALSQEVDVNAQITDLKLESSGQCLSHDIPEKPMTVYDEKKVISSNKLVNTEDHEGESVSSPGDVPNAAKDLSNDAENTDEIKGSNALNCGEEGQGFGGGKCDPLILLDGSPKAAGTLKPESESVILSRIHHSPESTH